MARPKPQVIFKDEQALETMEILASPGIWYVCYDNQPIGIAKRAWTRRGEVIKYPRTGFNNPAHAYKLAEKLNERFYTELFTVKEVK